MSRKPGKREEHARATRENLLRAANRLFAEHGYDATTVREIAHHGGVSERTFYRYFDGKRSLLEDDARHWIDLVHDAIRRRAAEEPDLTAVREGLLEVADQALHASNPTHVWLFRGPARPRTSDDRQRPLLFVELERSVVAALLVRHNLRETADPAHELRIELLSRTAVAAVRTAVIWSRRQRTNDQTEPGVSDTIRTVFAMTVEANHEQERQPTPRRSFQRPL